MDKRVSHFVAADRRAAVWNRLQGLRAREFRNSVPVSPPDFLIGSVGVGLFSRECRQELPQRNRASQFRGMLRLEAVAAQRNRQRPAVAVNFPRPWLERGALAISPEDDRVMLVIRHGAST
jgi:hypothetical protein